MHVNRNVCAHACQDTECGTCGTFFECQKGSIIGPAVGLMLGLLARIAYVMLKALTWRNNKVRPGTTNNPVVIDVHVCGLRRRRTGLRIV